MSKRPRGPLCLLCKVALAPTTIVGVLEHPTSELCAVRFADSDGVSVDHKYELENGVIYEIVAEGEAPQGEPAPGPLSDPLVRSLRASIDLDIIEIEPSFGRMEDAIDALFELHKMPKLGGISGDRGWSSISTYQRCPYLWQQRYASRGGAQERGPAPEALEIGILIHVFLALYYQKILDCSYPLDPEMFINRLAEANINPKAYSEAVRLFRSYELYYADDVITPLAVEHHVFDPKTKTSCRYDLIVRLNEDLPGLYKGTYEVDHKSVSRFDDIALSGWANDGEILGQIHLYKALHLEKRFGELQGALVNLIGKQTVPKFERIFVPATLPAVKDHKHMLTVWGARMTLAKAIGDFPRARANCINRYGKCDYYDVCSGINE